MSYVAIARKWRPQTFKEICGQKHITRTLENAIKFDRVHHAYLFSGPRGVGKTTAARTLARALNCEEGPSISPCGVCSNCLEILKGRSPDVIEIDGASNNSVDNVREIRESAQYMPVKSAKKIYIVDEVHMLSKGAFNALLKTLEEPPSHILFLFATTEPQKIPDTILSRVQRFEFKRIPSNIVTKRLKSICDAEGIKIAEGGLQLIARAGEGSMRDSQSLLDQVISFSGDNISVENVAESLGLIDRALLYKMLEGIVFSRPSLCLEAINTVYSYGYDLTEFSSEMLEVLRNATLLLLSDDAQQYLDISKDEQKQLQKTANKVTPDVLVRSFKVMLETHEQLARSHRPKLVLEMSVARLISIRPAQPIDKLIERLGRLEQTPPRPKEPLPPWGTQENNRQKKSVHRANSPLQSPKEHAQNKVPQKQWAPTSKSTSKFTDRNRPQKASSDRPLKKEQRPLNRAVSASVPEHPQESSLKRMKSEPSKDHSGAHSQKTNIPPKSDEHKAESVEARQNKTTRENPRPNSSLQNDTQKTVGKTQSTPLKKTLPPEILKKRDHFFLLFSSVREEIKALGHEFDLLSNHAAIIEISDTTLRLGISKGFKLEYAKSLLRKAELLSILRKLSPKLKNISAVAKKADSPFESHLEHKERLLQQKRESLKEYLLQDTQFQLLQSIIPFEFLKVKLEEEVKS